MEVYLLLYFEKKREEIHRGHLASMWLDSEDVCVCVCACVCEREIESCKKERERDIERDGVIVYALYWLLFILRLYFSQFSLFQPYRRSSVIWDTPSLISHCIYEFASFSLYLSVFLSLSLSLSLSLFECVSVYVCVDVNKSAKRGFFGAHPHREARGSWSPVKPRGKTIHTPLPLPHVRFGFHDLTSLFPPTPSPSLGGVWFPSFTPIYMQNIDSYTFLGQRWINRVAR